MLPLQGMTVIAVEQYGAGPFGTMLLADLGADVIKIENPADNGEIGRHVGPFYFDEGNSHFYQSFNRNKRSLTLNLKHPEGMAIFHDLVRKADAVLDNLRGDLPAKLGLTYEHLAKVNPRIVCAHLSAYGRDSQRAAWPGYDYLMQAEAGYLSVTGEPDAPPTRFGVSIIDMMTGLLAAFGLASGVIGARANGKGMDVDVSLFDTALHNLTYLATWYLNGGHMQGREPRGAHPSLTPSQMCKTADGWIFIMCNKEKFWPLLVDKLGHPEWATDPRFCDFKARLANRDEMTAALDDALQTRTTAQWMEMLGGLVPVAPVYDIAQALDNPFVTTRGRLADFEAATKDGDAVRMLASPIRIGGETIPTRGGPALGADTETVLAGLGIDGDRLADLRAKGVL